ncbi:MAG: alpha/beta hydrolase: peptidase or carbohydrate esterase [Phycisphaerales bacterium]|nr:alpha/beta hydrolase: peptidase or carbohydrate esterase [Phycisphaerales bacterium]
MKSTAALRIGFSVVLSLFTIIRVAQSADIPLDKVKRIPPAGVMVPATERTALEAGLADLAKEIDAVKQADPVVEIAAGERMKAIALLADVEIYRNAVRYALAYDEFFKADEIGKAKTLLNEGTERAKSLREGKAPWTTATGLVVRGYVSKIDGSVQPYGMIVPESWAKEPARKRRLDIWYHGRGENLSEVNFLMDREKSRGEFAPKDAFVLHPYGRYCNANRFAGEVDTFEALESVKKNYAIDDDRILVRGFSMGGAACWMFATHHAGLWAAAAPGAGFSETAGFLHISDLSQVPWYQQKLWHLYDSTDVAINLFNCPTVAYSGELDGQKQAADMMVKACADVRIDLAQVIGAGAHHNYVPAAKEEINRRLDSIAQRGRNPLPARVKFATYSLRYNTMDWITIDAMEHHWEKATVDAEIINSDTVKITTQNVAAMTIAMPPGLSPLDTTNPFLIGVNGRRYRQRMSSDRSLTLHLVSSAELLQNESEPAHESDNWSHFMNDGLRKVHGLQGPIDDAFMDSFIMITPTGKPLNDKTAAWVKAEEAHAIEHWRRQFRGEAHVKDDSAVTDADIANSNLVLWGDPSSNKVLAKIADKLPIKWDGQTVIVGEKSYAAAKHVPVMIYPNPLNPKRYVVLNSGFTFREYDYENNARQTPKLPDWAVVDVDVPASANSPGGIAGAGFFGEKWEIEERSQKPEASSQNGGGKGQ